MVKPQKTIEQEIKCIAHNTKMLLGITRRKSKHVQLSTAQAKAIARALLTVELYLDQPEKVRRVLIQRAFDARTTLEMEYREQTGKEMEK